MMLSLTLGKYINYKLSLRTAKFIYGRHTCRTCTNMHDDTQTTVQDFDGIETEDEEDPMTKNLLMKYIRTVNPNALNILPKKYYSLRLTKRPNFYLIDQNKAKEFVALISKDLKDKIYTVESDPGFGFITEELLNIGIPMIHLYEGNPIFHSSLKILQNKYPDRIKISRTNIFKTSIYWSCKDKFNSVNDVKIMKDMFEGMPEKKWEEDNNVQIIATVNTIDQLKITILNVIFRTWFMMNGRPVFYLAVLPSLWKAITQDNTKWDMYNTRSIMFQLLYDYKLLGTIDRQAFLPWQKKVTYKSKFKYDREIDHKEMYVVRLEPKADMYETIGDPTRCWWFVRHNLMCRKKRIIPSLESLVPGCGPRLIGKNINIYTEFGELNPEQILAVYKEFSSWSDSNNSDFFSNAEIHSKTFIKNVTDIEHDDVNLM